jgi:hypothetical protein
VDRAGVTVFNLDAACSLFKSLVFLPRFNHYRKIGVGVFPYCEKLVISFARVIGGALQKRSPRQSEVRQRNKDFMWGHAAAIQDLLIFIGGSSTTGLTGKTSDSGSYRFNRLLPLNDLPTTTRNYQRTSATSA